MKIKISNVIRYIIVCIILVGCTDNSIYLDINNKGVYTKLLLSGKTFFSQSV